MNKKNLILAGILLLLLAVALVYKGPFKEWKEDKGKTVSFLDDLDTAKADRIEIEGKGEKKTFVKVDGNWKEDGSKSDLVNDDAVDAALDALEKAKEEGLVLVSEVREKQAEFETSGPMGLRVVVKEGEGTLEDFVVGKNGTDFTSSYISESGSNSTYSANANLSATFAISNWYDKTIFALAGQELNKIRFQFPSREFTIEKKEGRWEGTLPYKFEVSEEKMNEVVEIMSNLQSAAIPEQKFEGTGLEKNLMIVQATGEGVDEILMVGDKNDQDQYFAKRGDSDNIYLVTKEQHDTLNKRISDFK